MSLRDKIKNMFFGKKTFSKNKPEKNIADEPSNPVEKNNTPEESLKIIKNQLKPENSDKIGNRTFTDSLHLLRDIVEEKPILSEQAIDILKEIGKHEKYVGFGEEVNRSICAFVIAQKRPELAQKTMIAVLSSGSSKYYNSQTDVYNEEAYRELREIIKRNSRGHNLNSILEESVQYCREKFIKRSQIEDNKKLTEEIKSGIRTSEEKGYKYITPALRKVKQRLKEKLVSEENALVTEKIQKGMEKSTPIRNVSADAPFKALPSKHGKGMSE